MVLKRVILFTGHRIDSPGRETPRFPVSLEKAARQAIRDAIQNQSDRSTLGVSGGANGGDILFLEVCEELGIKSEMLLALPVDQFVKASVQCEDPNWVRRFYRQLAIHPNPPVFAEVHEGDDFWPRHNRWLWSQALSHDAEQATLITLWDGESGDGPGGTEDMVNLAMEHSARIIWLNIRDLAAADKPQQQSA